MTAIFPQKSKNFTAAEAGIRAYLKELGIEDQEAITNTPIRWLKFLEQQSIALREPYTDFKVFEEEYNQMIVVDCEFSSLCKHHLLPYYGKAVLGYMPRRKVIGVSKIIKMITHTCKKPSIQEGLTQEICDIFNKALGEDPTAVGLVMQAMHTCVSCRYKEGHMLTSSMHGTFKHNPFAKQEFLGFAMPKLYKE